MPSAGDPDQDLVPGLRAGERAALRVAYERHGARVQRLCRGLLGRTADAEDAAQDVFLKLFERAHAFDGRARFTTWLHRLTVNLCLHRLERERRRAARPLDPPRDDAATRTELVDPGEPPERALARTEARESLERLLARLSPEHRTIVVLRELEGLGYQQISEVLAIPEGTVMSRLSRARGELVRLATLAHERERAREPGAAPRPILDRT